MDLHTIEICAGVGMLGEGLRAGLAHMGITHRTIAYIEREAYPASVLVARMEEGSLDAAPVWPDLLTFDGRRFRGVVDCIAAGFPCQDLSLAGKRAGLDGSRSGLFFDILDIADDSGAWSMLLENVTGIASATASVVDEAEGDLDERAAARVLGELADRGWNAEWLTLSASDVGASHGRSRWFCWAWRMGDTRLQHQHLQQRKDGSEHSGAGGQLADASSWDGRELAWADQRRLSKPDGGIAQAAAMGHTDRQRTHRSGPPRKQTGCAESSESGGGMADATGNGRHQGRPEPSGKQGRSDAAECGGAVANPECACDRGEIKGTNHRESESVGPADRPSRYCSALANTSSPRQQGAELGRARDGHRGGRKHMDQLANFVAFSPLAQPIRDGQESSPEAPTLRQHLNPLFGAWLMGWPSTWAIAEPRASSALETELWRSKLQQHLSCLLDGQDLCQNSLQPP